MCLSARLEHTHTHAHRLPRYPSTKPLFAQASLRSMTELELKRRRVKSPSKSTPWDDGDCMYSVCMYQHPRSARSPPATGKSLQNHQKRPGRVGCWYRKCWEKCGENTSFLGNRETPRAVGSPEVRPVRRSLGVTSDLGFVWVVLLFE